MSRAPASFQAIIRRFPDQQVIAQALDLPYQTVASWNKRDFIPSAYWPRLVRLAANLDVKGVSRAVLMRLYDAHEAERLNRVGERRLRQLVEHIARRG